jgi:hypothetical protein
MRTAVEFSPNPFRFIRPTATCPAMGTCTQGYVDDPRDDAIQSSVNGARLPREKAVVSVFDSGFALGDGVLKGLRLIDGGIAFLDPHLHRPYEGAKAIDMDIGLSPDGASRRFPAPAPPARPLSVAADDAGAYAAPMASPPRSWTTTQSPLGSVTLPVQPNFQRKV